MYCHLATVELHFQVAVDGELPAGGATALRVGNALEPVPVDEVEGADGAGHQHDQAQADPFQRAQHRPATAAAGRRFHFRYVSWNIAGWNSARRPGRRSAS